jgi:regulator of CtrA degradation
MDTTRNQLTPKLLDSLYTETMVLADEARFYFDQDRTKSMVPINVSVAFSCESLKVTTRLMHSIAWLLHQKAVRNGEYVDRGLDSEASELGYAPASDDFDRAKFPKEAQEIIAASEDIYYRLQRIDNRMRRMAPDMPMPLQLIEQIRAAY